MTFLYECVMLTNLNRTTASSATPITGFICMRPALASPPISVVYVLPRRALANRLLEHRSDRAYASVGLGREPLGTRSDAKRFNQTSCVRGTGEPP